MKVCFSNHGKQLKGVSSMSELRVFGNRNQGGRVNFPVVTITYDARTPIHITTGDKELWLDIITPEGEKYILEINCSMDE